ncbi:MAG: SUMF1/EgtB/PvdO family nonheme iron enzyme, partial [Opitutae bacterium]|nr:SUMF1/EgtB/PvdO family nonheme iron enzyme [Opitutae bacterium]
MQEAKPERNRKRSADYLVTEDSDEEEILSTAPVAAAFDGIYVFSQKTKERYGPYTMMQLQKFVDQGYFTAHDLAIYQGLEKWVTLEHIPDIRFPVAELPAEPEAEPEPVAEEILAPEEDAPALGTELVEDAESEQRQSEIPAKRNLAGSLFRVVAMVCSFLILFLYLCDIMNQHLGWNIPLGLGMVGISTTDDAMELKNYQSQDVADTTSKSIDIATLTAELERTKIVTVPNTYIFETDMSKGRRKDPFEDLPPLRELKKASVAAPVKAGKAFTIPDLSMEMLWVKAGVFEMGGPPLGWHEVTLTEGYWLGKYEVTQAQWEKIMGFNPSFFKGASRPVEQVSWTRARTFCKKLTEVKRRAGSLPAGMAYQLPTEAQWEYACRAGTTTAYAFGVGLTHDQANIRGGPGETTVVGKYPANPWGFQDMHGNIREWCEDRHAGGSYPSGSVTDPVGPAGIFYIRVARG